MEGEPESISGLFARLADDASVLVRSEFELYRARAFHRLSLSQGALALFAFSLLFAMAAVCCLLVMLAIALSRFVGPVGAGLVVSIGALALAGILAKLGFNRLHNLIDDDASERQS